MNKARRARQKANREHAHPHRNKAARTTPMGEVLPCLRCRPPAPDPETRARLPYRPMSGSLQWGAAAINALTGRGSQTVMEATLRRLRKGIPVQETPPAFTQEDDDEPS